VVWIVQFVPFQRSASEPPTAMQRLVDGQDTADSAGPEGVVWIVHAVPFHVSARVPLLQLPTATQAVADGHDTPDRLLGVAWEGYVGTHDQPVPFHCIAIVPVTICMPRLQANGQ